jgi:hypothetical protein
MTIMPEAVTIDPDGCFLVIDSREAARFASAVQHGNVG